MFMNRRDFCKAVYSKAGYVQELTPALIDAVIQEPGTIALILSGGAQNDRRRAEVHAAWDRLSHFTQGFYSNLTNADQSSIDDNFGPNRARLLRIKQQFDPGNLFRLNANIGPAAPPKVGVALSTRTG